ncbi:MAG: hypothetical protein C0396_02875 [Anaerolinea sp.]|nr:hypothetical protein [Anaerolinea sp.]
MTLTATNMRFGDFDMVFGTNCGYHYPFLENPQRALYLTLEHEKFTCVGKQDTGYRASLAQVSIQFPGGV